MASPENSGGPPKPITDAVASNLFASLDTDTGGVTPDQAVIGGWHVLRLLGRGAAGDVFLVSRPGSAAPAALKLMRTALAGDHAARVWREWQVLQDLRLDCVPRLLDFGVHLGRPFMVSEFVDGADLQRHCDERNLTLRDRAALLAGVADAAQRVHEQGVIHRDLKPSNVLVVDRAAGPQPVIIDFGTARLLDAARPLATLTAEGAPVGTPAFMAPEQARGERHAATTRADVYALGAIGYTLLTGHPPHDTDATLPEVIRRVAQDEPRDPRTLRPDLPGDLAAVLRKACEHDPSRRYAGAAHLADELRRWLRNEPVDARHAGPWRRAARWIGKHPVATTAAACLLLISGSVATAVATIRWINRQPTALAVSADGSYATLRSRSGNVLMNWDGQGPRAILLAAMAADADGRQTAVLGFGSTYTRDGSAELCVLDPRAPTRFAWRSGTRPPDFQPPGGAEENHGAFRLSRASVADVFPERPGDEVLAVHNNRKNGMSCLRIYALDGEVLYEAWHWGHLSSVQWLGQAGVLVAAGVANRHDLEAEIQLASGRPGWPAVVFALRPDAATPRVGWVRPSLDRGRTLARASALAEPLWYRTVSNRSAYRAPVVPPDLSAASTVSAADAEAEAESGPPAVLTLSWDLPRGPALRWLLAPDGAATPDLTNDAYERAEREGELPAANTVGWEPLAEEAPAPDARLSRTAS